MQLSKGSLAVRVGLGETELVNETRAFLEQHGVNFDAFSRRVCVRDRLFSQATRIERMASLHV